MEHAKPACILLIEDDLGLARLVQRRLDRHGMRVDIVGTGEDGIERVQQAHYDAVVLDLRLPGCDGLEVLRRFQALGVTRPTVMVSGAGEIPVVVGAMRLGAADYLTKDVDGGYLDLLPEVLEKVFAVEHLKAERSRIEADLAKERLVMRAAIESINQGLSVFDGDLRLALWNKQFLVHHDYPVAFGQTGMPLETFIRFNADRGDYGDEDKEAAVARRLEAARAAESYRYERRSADGRTIEVLGNPMPTGGFVATYTDVTERKENERRVWYQANYDALTGLPNRSYFETLLKERLARAEGGHSFALLFIDLDGFKTVNDTFGHTCGDALLCQVAERMKSRLRVSDVVARIGGDEFIALIGDIASGSQASAIAASLIETVSQPVQVGLGITSVSASIGITLCKDPMTPDEIVRRADLAMYAAKGRGKKCSVLYADEFVDDI